jgi:hypothetical protein
MSVQTVAGASISISASTPATFDQSGYEAVFTASPGPAVIGEISDAGQHGRVYNVVTHNPIGSRGTQKYKGSFNEGQKVLTVGIDDDDAGQTLAITALNDDDDYSFKVLYQDGSADYFQAKVIGFQKSMTGVDTMLTATLTLEITTSSGGVGIVHVAAA